MSSFLALPLLLIAGAVAALTAASTEAADNWNVMGESLVLIGAEPARVWRGPILGKNVVLRSTYLPGLPNTVVFTEGKDYTIDAIKGQIRRLEGSRIRDYSKNVLFGQKDFNHSKFPGFTNNPDFVFVDYRAGRNVEWPVQPSQTRLLERTKSRIRKGEPVKVVAFGDSITSGGEATSPALIYWQRWVDAVKTRNPKAQITAVNGATGGDTSTDGLKRIQEKVLSAAPDLVLVAFGMNDQNVGFVPLNTFEANLREMVKRIRETTPAEIVLVSGCTPNPNWHWASGKMGEYAAVTRKVASETRCAYADVYSNWKAVVDAKKPEDLLANNVNHPNDFGHWIYFQVLDHLGL